MITLLHPICLMLDDPVEKASLMGLASLTFPEAAA